MDFRKMLGIYRHFRAGAPLGDVAVLKIDALATPSPELVERLAGIRGYAPRHSTLASPEAGVTACMVG